MFLKIFVSILGVFDLLFLFVVFFIFVFERGKLFNLKYVYVCTGGGRRKRGDDTVFRRRGKHYRANTSHYYPKLHVLV